MYEYHESYKHKLAKELLYSWLKEIHDDKNIDYSNDHPFGRYLPFNWRKNYGVYMELPFYTTSDPYYFECSKGVWCDLPEHTELESCDCERDENSFIKHIDKGKILFVPDITIFHKGTAKILIEVFHTNPVSPNKMRKIAKFFEQSHIEVYQIDAENILVQTNKNRRLIFEELPVSGPDFEIKYGTIKPLSFIRKLYGK